VALGTKLLDRHGRSYNLQVVSWFAAAVTLTDECLRVLAQWDTVGHEGFFPEMRPFLRGTQCLLLCFSLAESNPWPVVLRREAYAKDNTCPRLLVGLQCDRSDRTVTTRDAAAFAVDQGWPYIECSAKTGDNVDAGQFTDRREGGGGVVQHNMRHFEPCPQCST
jgi:GTPase SAR1 family protein